MTSVSVVSDRKDVLWAGLFTWSLGGIGGVSSMHREITREGEREQKVTKRKGEQCIFMAHVTTWQTVRKGKERGRKRRVGIQEESRRVLKGESGK